MSTPEGSVSTGLSPGFLREIQRRMLLIRLFDQRACDLLMQGHVPGVLHTSTNQEAAVVGATMALREDDYMTGNHRSHGHPIGKGAHVRGLMAELLGKRTGTCRGKGARCTSPTSRLAAWVSRGLSGPVFPWLWEQR